MRRIQTVLLTVLAVFFAGVAFAQMTSEELKSELAIWRDMLDQNLISQQEYDKERRRLLDVYKENATQDAVAGYCNYGGESDMPGAPPSVAQYSESASVSQAVKEILDASGLAPNFIVRQGSVPNAAAIIRGTTRYIEYSDSFIDKISSATSTNWAMYSIMAHEIGHHLQGHTIQSGGSRPDIELEADEYSGFILAKMGASLGQAKTAMNSFGSPTGSATHPARADRLKAIERGWTRGSKNTSTPDETPVEAPVPEPVRSPQTTPQAPQWTHACVVGGDSVRLAPTGQIVNSFGIQVGMVGPAVPPNCVFTMQSNVGTYCVTQTGTVLFGTPMPVGQCSICGNGNC